MEENTKRDWRTMYPDDGGLKEPVRGLGEVFNVFDMIRKHFKR